MGIKDILNKLVEKEDTPVEEDDVTKDKYLRSLRRENRVIEEEREKKYLIKKIAEYKKHREREHLWGFKSIEQEKSPIFNKGKKCKGLYIGNYSFKGKL